MVLRLAGLVSARLLTLQFCSTFPSMNDLNQLPEAMQRLMTAGSFGAGLDITYDELRLIGAVIGMITLVQTATYSNDPKARVAAAKALVNLDESPEVIVDRLKAAPFGDLNIKQLEFVVGEISGGRTDLTDIYDEARETA